ncbi:hypothetical protein CPT03_07605 [Pedobacter ginsengisoli]|uniref:Recombinase zinc beta ribbon domain-containing protein n=1 Tax=Pedobacter ginsengisoli TaxID=363852 RepID=A0A2D1U420_9SPHI|nr:hypothetical protein [Pedobacter ginsengisoli]ATP56346.1 hypothetical protein CPT03_07605 [Pedobacter ginsengisoli]
MNLSLCGDALTNQPNSLEQLDQLLIDNDDFRFGKAFFHKGSTQRIVEPDVQDFSITVPATRTEDAEFVNGIHEPLITEELFGKVQSLIDSRRTRNAYKQRIRSIFPLRGFLTCPFCDRRSTASVSTGRNAKYRYYHCSVSRCKGRIRADILDEQYEEKLKKVVIKPEVYELFQLILKDEDISITRQEFLNERNKIHKEISEQELLISKIRRHFLEEKIDFNDFSELKKECKEVLGFLNEKLTLTNERLSNCYVVKCDEKLMGGESSVLKLYKNQDVAGMKFIIELFTPSSFNPVTKELNPLQINQALSMITTSGD